MRIQPPSSAHVDMSIASIAADVSAIKTNYATRAWILGSCIAIILTIIAGAIGVINALS